MPSFTDIFEWKDSDENGDYKIYYNCTLLMKVGEHEKGSEFDYANVDEGNMIIYFPNIDGTMTTIQYN